MLVELLAQGVFEGARIGLASLGFALIFYTSKELHFAYGVLLAASAYVAYALIVFWQMPGLVAIVSSLVFGALVGSAVHRFMYRRLPNHLAVLLISFGMTIVLESLLHIIFGSTQRVLPPSGVTEVIVLGGRVYTRVIDFMTLGAFVVIWIALAAMMARTKTGLAIRAVMRDEEMSELVGIRTAKTKVLAYGIGSAIGAASGLVMVARSSVHPGAGFDILLFAFIITLLGLGRLHMVAVWGLTIGVFMSLIAWQLPAEFRTVFAFLLMLGYLVRRQERPGLGKWILRLRAEHAADSA